MDFTFRAHVHALRGFVEDEQLRLRREPAGEGNFLLIAATQRTARRIRPVSLHPEVADEIQREQFLRAEPQPRTGKNPPVNRHRHVVRDGHFENHAVATAIFRHIRDAMCDRFLRRANGDTLAVQQNFSSISGRDAEQDSRQFRPPRADQAGHADNFARANIERDILYAARRAADVLERENNFSGCAFGGRINGGDFAADHEFNEFGLGQRSSRRKEALINCRLPIADCRLGSLSLVTSAATNIARAHAFAIAQHRHSISERKNFLQPMRDVDDADAARPQIFHDGEQ